MKETEKEKKENRISKLYFAESIATYLLVGLFVYGASHYMNPIFSLLLFLLSTLALSLIHERKLAAVPNYFLVFTSFSCGIGVMQDMWVNWYVLLPGIVLLVIYGVITILYREEKLKKTPYYMVAVFSAFGVCIFEILRYRIPDSIFHYFAEHPLNIKSFFTWLTICSQGSLGFLLPAAGMALILFFATKESKEEKGICLIGAAILAFILGFFGFFGYKDIASPLLLLSVVIVSGMNEGLPTEGKRLQWGRQIQLYTIGYSMFLVVREYLSGRI